MRYVLMVAIILLYGTIGWKVSSAALSLLNEPSTNKVMGGYALLGLLVASLPVFLYALVKMSQGIAKDIDKGSKHLGLMLMLTTGVTMTSGCTRIDAGHVGIVVNLAGDQRGVQELPAQTGRVWYNPFGTQVFEYPTFVQTAVWTKDVHEGRPVNEEITFTNSDSMQFAADISIGYHLERDKVPAFYVKFRSDDLDSFTHGFMRNLAREKFDTVAGKYKLDQIMGDNAKFMAEVRASLQNDLDPIGVVIDQFGFIGAPRPPESVIASINAKNAATQKAMQVENELRQSEAEAKKLVARAEGEAKAEVARAKGDAEARRIRADTEAYANQTVAKSLTPLVIEYWRVTKWNGQMPQVTGGNSGTMFQLQTK